MPQPPARRTGKRVAVVGSGPAGLACAQQLARAGHAVTVFEKQDRIGGLLRYGIPDFKMEKALIDRRHGADGGGRRDVPAPGSKSAPRCRWRRCWRSYDAVVLAGGAEWPRDLEVPGRELAGIHFAMDFLTQQNKRGAGDGEARAAPEGTITAGGKHVVVIGGGDTGSDCIGTSIRQGAASVTQLEILPKPPERENKALTWPDWPMKLRSSHAHEEGCERDWAVLTQARDRRRMARSQALECARVEWAKGADGRMTMREVPGSEFQLQGRSGAAGDGVPRAAAVGAAGAGRRGAGRARQCAGEYQCLSTSRAEGVRRGRHAARPVAGGVGDPRGPPMRPRGRSWR